MKKVAIVSCYFMKNYGSVLQAYATQKILDDLKIPNETISILGLQREIKFAKMKYFYGKVFDIDVIKSKWTYVKHGIHRKLNSNGFEIKMQLRSKAFDKFISIFHLSESYNSFYELHRGCEKYSSVVVGSDQLWLPSNISADYYTLNWVPHEVNKISYATSFGVSSLEPKYQELAKQFLQRINHLSVREQSGQKLIKEIAGLDTEIVCDPTLLFTEDDWMEIQSPRRLIDGKYIFCYFIGNNQEHRAFVKRLKELTGYKIVALQHIDEYIKSDEAFADEAPYDVLPGDFINLIRNAEYVCTDSFHGTIFSILNKKKFFTFRRFKARQKVSTNSRLDSLFNLLALQERYLSADQDASISMYLEINYDSVEEKLAVFREESKQFLKNALGREHCYD